MRLTMPTVPAAPRRARPAIAAALGLALAALPAAVHAQAAPEQPTILNPVTPSATELTQLFWIIFWMAVAVFIVVEGLIVYAALHFRRRPADATPPQFHDSTKVEIAWTVAPVVIVLALAIFSQQKLMAAYAPPPDALTIEVTGKQWFWKYVYDEPIAGGKEGQKVTTATELVVPVNRDIRLNMQSEDVLHAWWVPQLSGKQDAEPGKRYAGWEKPFIWFRAEREGTFLGQCAELCGTQHAGMRIAAHVVSQAAYDEWLANQARPAVVPPAGSAAARGRELITTPANKCLACHTIYGNDTMLGVQGPNLTHVASRERLAGGTFERTDENLKKWIHHPDDLKYGSRMVLTGVTLTDEQIGDIVAYLQSLK
jgi:cytochrome c oxidase subunit 2